MWQPQPGPQYKLLACPVEDVFLGGGRGGGKTDGILGDWINHSQRYGKDAIGILFRRTYGELEEVERRCNAVFPSLGARLNVQRKTWQFPNRSSLRLRYLDRDSDADNYQGHSYTYIAFDELTNWPFPDPIDKLRACLRSAAGVPCKMRSSGNPGGPGHNWVKARYIDPAPPYAVHTDEMKMPDGSIASVRRVFVQALLDDNVILQKNDPHYWERIAMSAAGNEALLKAWRYGLWDIVAGGAFDDLWLPDVHVIPWFPIPSSWYVDRSFDWGSSSPFSVGWWAESDGTTAPNGRTYPRGTIFAIAEWYGWNGEPNKGLKMTAAEIARRIKEIEGTFKFTVNPGPADTQIFDTDVSFAADMERQGVLWTRADKSPGSRKRGFDLVRSYLKASLQRPMEDPGLFVFDTCRQFIRTVPVLPRDKKKPDDVDSAAEDHIFDTLKYKLINRRNELVEVPLVGW